MPNKETPNSSDPSVKIAIIVMAIITLSSNYLIFRIDASPELRLYACLISLLLGGLFVHDIIKEPNASLSKHLLSKLSKVLTIRNLRIFHPHSETKSSNTCVDGKCGQCPSCDKGLS